MTPKSLAFSAIDLVERIPYSVISLVSRLAIVDVFWRSGQTKVDGWQVTQTTIDLFRDEYRVPLLPPEVAAYMAAIQEHLFSALLLIGLASRLSAFGLFAMTMVIQIFVYPANWPDHLLWSSVLIFIIARGPGAISLDYLIRSGFERNPTASPAAARVRDPSTVGA
jgi:putative oxidoreductase